MKAAIGSISTRVIIDGKSSRSRDNIWFRKYLLNIRGASEVDFISLKLDKEEGIEYYKHLNEVDYNDYDEFYIMCDNNNYFGGKVSEWIIQNMKHLSNYRGKVFYIYTDPSMFIVDFAGATAKGITNKTLECSINLTPTEVDNFNKVMSDCNFVFIGYDYGKFLKQIPERNRSMQCKFEHPGFYAPLIEYMWMNTPIEIFNDEKQYDLVYYGDNRTSYRQKKVKMYFNNSLQKNLISMNAVKNLPSTTYTPKLKHSDLIRQIQLSKASIVIGDAAHSNNLVSPRYFENIKSNILSFIDKDFDPMKILYKDEVLQDLMYVYCSSQLVENYNHIINNGMYDDIIDRQWKELSKFSHLIQE